MKIRDRGGAPKAGTWLDQAREALLPALIVALINLPLSCGIAMASGAPAIAGLIAAIVSGLIFPLLGGTHVAIPGPAAGLAPALLAGTMLLGHGDRAVGYPLLLVAVALTGPILIIIARLRLARYAAVFPASVVHGMLAGIGLMIIAKQFPLIIGRRFHHTSFWGIVGETPHQLLRLDGKAALIGVVCLATVFGLDALKGDWKKVVPPLAVAVVIGLGLSGVLDLEPRYLLQLPTNPLAGITMPNFRGALAGGGWIGLLETVPVIAIIMIVEALATAAAVDKLDLDGRKSDPNRVLRSVGVTSLCSSLLGGLPIIPEAGRSNAAITAGSKGPATSFMNAVFMLVFLFLGGAVIRRLPLAALGAVIIFVGWRLCKPSIWRQTAKIGRDQLLVFAVTAFMTVTGGLFEAILIGMVTELLVTGYFVKKYAEPGAKFLPTILGLWKNPVEKTDFQEEALTWHIHLGGHITAFNHRFLAEALADAPAEATVVKVHFRDVRLIDHTAAEELRAFAQEVLDSGRDLHGYERAMKVHLPSASGHEDGLRFRLSIPAISQTD